MANLWLRSAFLIFGTLISLDAVRAADAARIASKKDTIYGVVDGAGLLADLAWPENQTAIPAIVMIHGGRWRSSSKNDTRYARQGVWASAGFFAMNIDYRLVNSVPAPACYQDLFTAIRWMHEHAAEYGIDVSRIYLLGDSSGGHEVSLAATLGPGPYPKTGGWDKASADFRAVISISGAYDLNTLSWGNLWTPLKGAPATGFATLAGAELDEARRLASPIRHIGPQTKPMLLLHSDDDRSVPVQQAVDMDAALTEGHVPHKFIHYKDRGHMAFTDEAFQEAQAFILSIEGKK
jgi:acetyl esterase/lipase